ncbi:MAG TPA: XrtA system polysaccharide chain length determinant [Saccharospirillum sp.]|nr:XrtA system polysaccharide chain length determinant [Saccharospirillum sp.]
MDLRFILDTLRAMKLELFRYRVLAALVFMAATSAILAMGYITPKTYTSNAVLYADNSNILAPLLSGSAEVTAIDRISEAREMLQSRSLLEDVAVDSGLFNANMTDAERNSVIADLRRAIQVRVTGGSFLNLSYTSGDASRSFQVLSAVLTRFIERTATEKRAESRNAFEFIDSQVQTYKRQLEEAETTLKNFQAENFDGSQGSVQSRIENLRAEIQTLELHIQETTTQLQLTRQQLAEEEPYREVIVQAGQSDLEQRMASMQSRLDTLRLQYLDTHPDVIALKDQITELEQQQLEGGGLGNRNITEVIENQVYEDLRIRLTNYQTELAVQQNRLVATRQLLQEAYDRAERVAENQAELQELTRDYDVTRGVYEDMLERRERARLSMTLDVEGQGISYRIQEPATFPTSWNEMPIWQIGIAGPILGSGLVVGLLGMLVLFDQRIRSDRSLITQMTEDVVLLTTIPHYASSLKDRLLRWDIIALFIVLVVFMAVYGGMVALNLLGFQPAVIAQWLNLPIGPLGG